MSFGSKCRTQWLWLGLIAACGGSVVACAGGTEGGASEPERLGLAVQALGDTCTFSSFTAAPSAMQLKGASVSLSASATCTAGEAEYAFVGKDPLQGWVWICGYGTSPCTWATNTAGPGQWEIQAWARAIAHPEMSYEGWQAIQPLYTIAADTGTCSSVTAQNAPVTSASIGTSVTVTGAATCDAGAVAEYTVVAGDPHGHWSELCPWQTSPTCVWDTTGALPGDWMVQIWARRWGSGSYYDSYVDDPYTLFLSGTCTPTALSADPADQQDVGTDVTLTAAADCTAGAAQYRFVAGDPGGAWSELCGWQDGTNCTWHTNGATPGNWSVQVWTRMKGKTNAYDGYRDLAYKLVTAGDCAGALTAEPTPAAQQTTGGNVSIVATPTCTVGATPQFYFVGMRPDNSWFELCPGWRSSDTCVWNTTGEPTGAYVLQVWVRKIGSPDPLENYFSFAYAVVP